MRRNCARPPHYARRTYLTAASITLRPAGVAKSEPEPLFSMITATATTGLSAGA